MIEIFSKYFLKNTIKLKTHSPTTEANTALTNSRILHWNCAMLVTKHKNNRGPQKVDNPQNNYQGTHETSRSEICRSTCPSPGQMDIWKQLLVTAPHNKNVR